MGPVGSGKTTQAELLAKELNLPHIQTGEIYRTISQEDSPVGRKIKEILEKGDLIDDQTTFEVVDKHLAQISDGFVIEGLPRTLVQAQRELFEINKVLYIHISDQEAVARLLARGRDDDKPDIISERLKVYHQNTEPILDYYRALGKLMEIDGSGTIEEVHRLIMQAIDDSN